MYIMMRVEVERYIMMRATVERYIMMRVTVEHGMHNDERNGGMVHYDERKR